MHLMEERLLEYPWARATVGVADEDSGLEVPGNPITGTILMDLQEDSRIRFSDDSGAPERRGDFIGFTHDTDVMKGDHIETPDGLVEVVFISAWDDLEPSHRELTLRFV